MFDPGPSTTSLRAWVAAMQDSADPAAARVAASELFRRTLGRLEALARLMLRRYPSLRGWLETGDVLQQAALRLLRALQAGGAVESRQHFYRLAALKLRQELTDLARSLHGPHGLAANHDAVEADDPAEADDGPVTADEWSAFHEAVGRLPDDEREVFELRYYHGLGAAEAAALLGVSDDTAGRRWRRARLLLTDRLKGGEDA